MFKSLLISFLFLSTWQQLLFSQISADMGVTFGKGLGEMDDTQFWGIDLTVGFHRVCSPFAFGFMLMSKKYGKRTETLPMFTSFAGYGDQATVSNDGGAYSSYFFVRYNQPHNNPFSYSTMRRFSFFAALGIGWTTYQMIWRSSGSHNDEGLGLRDRTFSTMGEVGINLNWTEGDTPCGVISSGISLQWEYGGTVDYMNPKRRNEHFYYESGLSEESNTPFVSEQTGNYFSRAIHQSLNLRISLIKITL